MVCSASVVLEFGRNAYWVGEDVVVFGEVFHELVVDEGVDGFGDDGEQGDRAVVGWVGSVFLALYSSMTFVSLSGSG